MKKIVWALIDKDGAIYDFYFTRESANLIKCSEEKRKHSKLFTIKKVQVKIIK